MDGTGCWHDNVFVERLWKSIKCEEVYLYAYETASAAQQGLEILARRSSTVTADRNFWGLKCPPCGKAIQSRQ
jgi:hypothetical protein